VHTLYALGAKALEAAHLSGQVIGVNVHMHAGRPLA